MGDHRLARALTGVLGSAAFRRRGLPVVWATLVAVVVAEAIGDVLNPPGLSVEFVFHDWLHDAGGGLAALVCVAGVVASRHSRGAWAAIAAATVTFAIGQALWSALFRYQPPEPGPNLIDAFYLSFYPFAIAGLVLLTRAHVPRFEFHRWVDGIALVLIVATPGVALVLVPVGRRTTGNALADAVNFAYPLLDVLLAGAVLGVFAVTNWRPGACWAWLGLGFLLMAVPDSIATVQRLHGAYAQVHRPYHLESYDFLWTLGLAAIAYAAWRPPPSRMAFERPTGLRAIALPLTAQALAVATQVVSYFHDIPPSGRPLTLAVLLLSMVQIFLSRPRRGAMHAAEDTADAVQEVDPEQLAHARPAELRSEGTSRTM